MTNPLRVDLDALAELARRATPGPWQVHAGKYEGSDYCYVTEGKSNLADDIDPHDAAFIAAANPQTVLTLIDMARRAASPSEKTEPIGFVTAAGLQALKDGFSASVVAPAVADEQFNRPIYTAPIDRQGADRAGLKQAIAKIRELVPDECKPEDDDANQAGFRNAIDHVLQLLAPLAKEPT